MELLCVPSPLLPLPAWPPPCLTRKKLCKSFFVSKSTFAGTLMDLHRHAYDLSTFSMITVPEMRQEYFIEKFKVPPIRTIFVSPG